MHISVFVNVCAQISCTGYICTTLYLPFYIFTTDTTTTTNHSFKLEEREDDKAMKGYLVFILSWSDCIYANDIHFLFNHEHNEVFVLRPSLSFSLCVYIFWQG